MKKLFFLVLLCSVFAYEAKCQTKAEIRKEARQKENEKKKRMADAVKTFHESGTTPPNAEPGKCYAKCMIPDTTTKKNSWSQWEEVVCSEKITPKLVSNIVQVLKNKGYDVDINATVLTKEIKIEISKFQKAFNLPQSPLNIKTLDALGVRY